MEYVISFRLRTILLQQVLFYPNAIACIFLGENIVTMAIIEFHNASIMLLGKTSGSDYTYT